jgi:hypothetical protein
LYPSHTPHGKPPHTGFTPAASRAKSRTVGTQPAMVCGDYEGAVEEEREASRQARAVTAPAWLLTRTRRRKNTIMSRIRQERRAILTGFKFRDDNAES